MLVDIFELIAVVKIYLELTRAGLRRVVFTELSLAIVGTFACVHLRNNQIAARKIYHLEYNCL